MATELFKETFPDPLFIEQPDAVLTVSERLPSLKVSYQKKAACNAVGKKVRGVRQAKNRGLLLRGCHYAGDLDAHRHSHRTVAKRLSFGGKE
jgi:hypothetical protein